MADGGNCELRIANWEKGMKVQSGERSLKAAATPLPLGEGTIVGGSKISGCVTRQASPCTRFASPRGRGLEHAGRVCSPMCGAWRKSLACWTIRPAATFPGQIHTDQNGKLCL